MKPGKGGRAAAPAAAGAGGAAGSVRVHASAIEQLIPLWTKWVNATGAATATAAPTAAAPAAAVGSETGGAVGGAAAVVPIEKLLTCLKVVRPLVTALHAAYTQSTAQQKHAPPPAPPTTKSAAPRSAAASAAALPPASTTPFVSGGGGGFVGDATSVSLTVDQRVFELLSESLRLACADAGGATHTALVLETLETCALLAECDWYRDALIATELIAQRVAPLLAITPDATHDTNSADGTADGTADGGAKAAAEDDTKSAPTSAATASAAVPSAAQSTAVILAASKCLELCRKCAPFSVRYIGFGRCTVPLTPTANAPTAPIVHAVGVRRGGATTAPGRGGKVAAPKPAALPALTDRVQPHVLLVLEQDAYESTREAWRVWDGGILFGRWVYLNAELFAGRRVLEFGSGCCGVVGLTCAAVGAAAVVLSDYTPTINAVLQRNANRNRFAHCAVSVVELDLTSTKLAADAPAWLTARESGAGSGAASGVDFVLCAEIFHFPELGPGIARWCDTCLSRTNPHARVLAVSHSKRRGIDSTLKAMAERGFVCDDQMPGARGLANWSIDIVTDMRVFCFRRANTTATATASSAPTAASAAAAPAAASPPAENASSASPSPAKAAASAKK